MHPRCLVALAALLAVAGLGVGMSAATAADPGAPDYSQPANWLCRPGLADDACSTNLDTTVVRPDGTTSVEKFAPTRNPRFDCFYVYPTVSGDASANSDLVPGPEERAAVANQFARLGSQCLLYAPMYRQMTLASLFGRLATGTNAAKGYTPMDLAYRDVVDAWNYYLAHDNRGRGVVLIGHSQGSRHLDALIKDHIDGNPSVRSRVIGAYLLGWGVAVPSGKDVGGDFAHVPRCRRTRQTGCVVAYSTFRSTAPPPQGSYFGRSLSSNSPVACVNPAAPGGGPAPMRGYLATSTVRWARPLRHPTVDTPFVRAPGLLRGECVTKNGFTYLELTVPATPGGPIRDIGGDLTPQWGLHLVDVNVAMGDIVRMVRAQGRAYLARHAR
ncbi:MAG: DUF3089 domain-containing protein [Acidimicrobiia bacterium]